MLLLSLCALLFAACDSGSDDGPSGPSASRGEGTIVLGGTTHAFNVIACDFSGEVDDLYQTVSGKGTTSDGEDFDVFVSRNEVESAGQVIRVHTVSFQTGDVRSGGGTVIEAQRMFMNGSWTSLFDEPNEPLVKISGNTLTASGVFYVNDDLENTMSGSVTATCN